MKRTNTGLPGKCVTQLLPSHGSPKGFYVRILDLFTTIGPRLQDLELVHLNEEMFKLITSRVGELVSLRRISIDPTCGDWDWDGRGSPQIGASNTYIWPTLSFSHTLQQAVLVSTDLAMGSTNGGPLNIFGGTSSLQRLDLKISAWFVSSLNTCLSLNNSFVAFLGFNSEPYACLTPQSFKRSPASPILSLTSQSGTANV